MRTKERILWDIYESIDTSRVVQDDNILPRVFEREDTIQAMQEYADEYLKAYLKFASSGPIYYRDTDHIIEQFKAHLESLKNKS